MRYVLSCILLFVFCGSSFAEDLTKAQCEKIGGTYTKAGCLILGDSEKTKYSSKDVYMPGEEECNCQGGRWHKEHGCLAKVPESECKALGGVVHEELGCIQRPTQEQCRALGGNYQEGNCVLAPQTKPQPNPAVNRTCAKSRAVRLP
jgi:hypothetical protein